MLGLVVLGELVPGLVVLGELVPGLVVLGEEVWGVEGLLCVCEEPVLEGVLSGVVLCASSHVPESSTSETSVAFPFIGVPPPNRFV